MSTPPARPSALAASPEDAQVAPLDGETAVTDYDAGQALDAAPGDALDHVGPASYLTRRQTDVLLLDLSPSRVAHTQGQSNMAAWDIRAHLTRVFGFGRWTDEAIQPTTMIYETEHPPTGPNGKPRWSTAYKSTRRLTIMAPDGTPVAFYDGSAVGESNNQPSRGDAHDMAMKTAESQALKRCATNLGTQFGLSLYDNGTTRDVVRVTLVQGVGLPDTPVQA